MKRALFALTCVLALPVQAGQFEDLSAEGNSFAAGQKGYLDGLATGTDQRAGQYGGSSTVTADLHPCNQVNAQGQRTCGGQAINETDNPQQYYGMSKAQLEDTARVKASTDENAQFMFDGHNSRPDYAIRRDDPIFEHQEANQNAMVSLSDSYQGCKDIAYGGTVTSTEAKQCKKYGTAVYRENVCNRTRQVSCSNADANQPWPFTNADFNIAGPALPLAISGNYLNFGSQGNDRGQDCNGYDNYVTFNISNVNDIAEFKITSAMWDDSFLVAINGSNVHMAYGGNVGTNPMGQRICEFRGIKSSGAVVDLRPYLKVGQNTLRIWNKVGGGGNVFIQVYALRYKPCTVSDAISETCDGSFDKSKASLLSSLCTDGPRTTWLGRTSVSRDCWAWKDTYRWEDQPTYTEDAQCQAMRSAGCAPNGSTCDITSPSGWCKQATMNFTCTTASPEKTMQVCGDTLVCPDGHCYDAYKEPPPSNTQDFAKAASYLAAMEDMKKEFDPNNATVWKGEFKSCSVNETLVGSDKCCVGGAGTINHLGHSCNTTEQKINQARDDQRVTFLRSWTECTQKIAGVCISKQVHYEFCLWPSKLARIVQDQGRPMLGQAVANPCPGFKLQNPNEFAGIDWSRIDLSEYFSDVQAKYAATPKPTPDALTQQMQQSNEALQADYSQRMQQYYGQ